MKTLDGGPHRPSPPRPLGIAEGAFEIARKYLMQREQFKKPLYKNQHLAFRMVDLANEIEMAKYMVYKAACDKDEHKPFSASAAKAKLIAAETAMHVTTDAFDAGRQRLYEGVSRGTPHARRKDHPDLRGHQRNSEDRTEQRIVRVIHYCFDSPAPLPVRQRGSQASEEPPSPEPLWGRGFFSYFNVSS